MLTIPKMKICVIRKAVYKFLIKQCFFILKCEYENPVIRKIRDKIIEYGERNIEHEIPINPEAIVIFSPFL
jgi:hypothetical protein